MNRRRFAIVTGILIVGAVAANLPARVPVSNAATLQEVQTVTVTTTLQSANGGEPGDLMTSFKAGEVSGVSFKRGRIRYKGFAIVDRTHASAVSCDANDVEYGSVEREDGSWLGVAVCPKGPSTVVIAIPSLIRARASANDASAAMTCWENKELLMGVCYEVGTNPAGSMPQTREHILLARQVGVPH